MAWRRPGDKPLSESMMVNLLTHIYIYIYIYYIYVRYLLLMTNCFSPEMWFQRILWLGYGDMIRWWLEIRIKVCFGVQSIYRLFSCIIVWWPHLKYCMVITLKIFCSNSHYICFVDVYRIEHGETKCLEITRFVLFLLGRVVYYGASNTNPQQLPMLKNTTVQKEVS